MRNLLLFLTLLTLTQISGNIYRLSPSVQPTRYAIKLNLDLDRDCFTGNVSIYVQTLDFVPSINFHASNLTIQELFLNGEAVARTDSPLRTKFQYQNRAYELIEITARDQSMIPPGHHIVKVNYWARFSKPSKGLFKTTATYKDSAEKPILLGTDFETSFARTVIPCLDEPSLKAAFQLTLIIPNSTFEAISNTGVYRKITRAQDVVYQFYSTPRMSSYLLAFAVTRYSFGEFFGVSRVPIRAYGVNITSENSRKLLEFVDQTLQFCKNYTNVSYPLRKIDLIEFDRNGNTATENWGLVTLATGLLSPQDKPYTMYQKKAVLAHEIAHSWFGNLVTNQWWDDIWLQEGLATFMANKIENSLMATNHYNSQIQESLFYEDLTNRSRAVIEYTEHPLRLRDNFNDFSYGKSALIVAMIEQVLGPGNFQSAIQEYLSTYAYSSATTDDFLTIFQKYTNYSVDFRAFVESFMYQKEYPIIDVSETETHFVLRQLNSASSVRRNASLKWTLPLSYITSTSGNSELVWLTHDMDLLEIEKNENETWIKLNYKQLGYYRVVYSDSLWSKFIEDSTNMEPSERDHLIYEAGALYTLNNISCGVALKYIDHLHNASILNKTPAFYAFLRIHYAIRSFQEANEIFLKLVAKVFEYDQVIHYGPEMLQDKFNAFHDNSSQVLPLQQQQQCVAWILTNLS